MWTFRVVTMRNLPPPPSIRKNTPLPYKSLMQYHRHLKERHATTLANLESLKGDHQSTVNELHYLKLKLQSLDNKLERADDIEIEFEVSMLDGEDDMLELVGVTIKLATTSGQLVCLTQKYENAEMNYQQKAHRLASLFTELKDELDAHLGTKQKLADAAAELIVARSVVLDAAIDIDEARNQVFRTSAELLATNDDIAILEGLYQRRIFRKRWRQNRMKDGHCIKR
jgi:chromosome segregation ATPase